MFQELDLGGLGDIRIQDVAQHLGRILAWCTAVENALMACRVARAGTLVSRRRLVRPYVKMSLPFHPRGDACGSLIEEEVRIA